MDSIYVDKKARRRPLKLTDAVFFRSFFYKYIGRFSIKIRGVLFSIWQVAIQLQ